MDGDILGYYNDFWIFDIDGTLADCTERRKILDTKNRSPEIWKKFFELQETDPPYPATVKIAQGLIDKDSCLLFFTGRPNEYRKQTCEWLEKYLEFDETIGGASKLLLMRPTGSRIQDDKLKKDMLLNFYKFNPRQKIMGVFEDRPRCIEMYRKEGLSVFDTGTWVGEDKA